VIVKINPADVVAIPSDYKNTKGRCCRYEVVAEMVGQPSDYTGRAVIGDFDPKAVTDDGLDGIGSNPPFSESYKQGYRDGDEDAVGGLYQPDADQDADYYEGYDDAQNDFDEFDDDCGGCSCNKANASYGHKPSGQKFYNVRGKDGKFAAKS